MKRATDGAEPVVTAPMCLEIERMGGARLALVRLSGECDLDVLPRIDRDLRRGLGPYYDREHLVIDMAAVTFVDSSFLGFLVRLTRRLRARGRELVLACPTGEVRRVFALVGLPNVIPVYEDVDEVIGTVLAGRLPAIPPAFSVSRA